MMKYKTGMIAVLVLLLLLATPVFAQDGSATSEPSVTLSIGQVVLGIVAAVTAGGITGVMGAGVLAQRLKDNPATMKAIEHLGNSVPPETAKQVIDVLGAFQSSFNSVTALMREALDRIPADSKKDPPAEASSK